MWVEKALWEAGMVGELKCHFPGSRSGTRGWGAECAQPLARGDPAVPRPGQADSTLCSSPIFCCQLEPGVFLQII